GISVILKKKQKTLTWIENSAANLSYSSPFLSKLRCEAESSELTTHTKLQHKNTRTTTFPSSSD
ncbi:hypothetical protein LINPERPRIM_LOCUS2446, partial [Linum perenne]